MALGFAVEAKPLYPLLRRLEQQGLLTSDWNTEQPRPRKFYRTSRSGQLLSRSLIDDWNTLTGSINDLDKDFSS